MRTKRKNTKEDRRHKNVYFYKIPYHAIQQIQMPNILIDCNYLYLHNIQIIKAKCQGKEDSKQNINVFLRVLCVYVSVCMNDLPVCKHFL